MVYNNLLKRIFLSIILLTIYIFICFYNFELVFYLICIIFIMTLYEVFINFKSYKILILLYLSISFLSFTSLSFNDETIYTFNLMIFIIIIFDIFSFCVGKLFGKTKFLFKISPNKTLEGLCGGIFFSLLLSLIYCYYNNIIINFNLVYFIITLMLSAFIGDIIESIFKRYNNLKNSSNLLPGHGGFFDRFDSFIFTLIPYSILLRIL